MIKNFMPCYREYFNSNERLYLQIVNSTSFYIYFTLKYKLNTKSISRTSPVFAPRKKEHLLFPSDALNISFMVFNASNLPPTLIHSSNLPVAKTSCYDIIGNSVYVVCEKIDC